MQQTNQRQWKRSFLIIAVGQTISLVGSSAVQFALIWWLASETGSAMTMSLAGLFAFLPQLFLGPFVGVLVDRVKRKSVIIASDLSMGVIALIFSLFFIFGTPPYWTVFVVLGLRSVGNVFHQPSIQAAIPLLVPCDKLVQVNGWSQFMQSGAFMLGPVLGAVMYAGLPLWIILLSDLLGALVACATVAAVQIPDPPNSASGPPHVLREMKQGAMALVTDRPLLIVTLFSTIGMLFFMPLSSFYPLMSSNHFSGSAWHASLVELLFAAGMMGAALLFASAGNIKNKLVVAHWGLAGMAVSCIICGLLPTDLNWFWVFAVACGMMGVCMNIFNIPYVAYLQQVIAPEKMGRVFSLLGSLSSAAMPLGLLVAGPVAEKSGVALWFAISGLAVAALTGVSALLSRHYARKQL